MNITSTRKSNWITFLTYFVLILAGIFALFPIVWALSTSFKPESMVITSPPQWIPAKFTLENYEQVLFHSKIPLYLLNSIIVSLCSVVFTLVVAAHAGYAAARFHFKFRNSLLFFILMTGMIPGICVLVPLYFISMFLKIYNTFEVMILIYTAWQVPTIIWVLKGFFETIPRDIDDAALIDGCSPLRIFYQLMLPIAQPGLAASALLAFVYVWNDFLIAFTFTTKDNLRLVSVGLYNYLSQYGIVWGQLMAAVMLVLVPMIILFAILQTRFIQGLSAGASKG
jgi:multiple sugar transport system permease protein